MPKLSLSLCVVRFPNPLAPGRHPDTCQLGNLTNWALFTSPLLTLSINLKSQHLFCSVRHHPCAELGLRPTKNVNHHHHYRHPTKKTIKNHIFLHNFLSCFEHLINFHRFFVAPDKEALDAAGIQLKEMGLHVNFMIYCCALLIFLPILILLYCTFTFIGLDEMP